jgi:hypothetical protein
MSTPDISSFSPNLQLFRQWDERFDKLHYNVDPKKITYSQQKGLTVLQLSIQWNGRSYPVQIKTAQARESITVEDLDYKIKQIVILAIRYELGTRTQSLSFCPSNRTVVKELKIPHPDKKPAPFILDFSLQFQKTQAKSFNLTQRQITYKSGHYEGKIQLIAWARQKWAGLDSKHPTGATIPSDRTRERKKQEELEHVISIKKKHN